MSYSNYRKLYPRPDYIQPIVPSKTIDPVVASWAGVWSQEASSFVTPKGKTLDPRLVQSVNDPSATAQGPLTTGEITWTPAFAQAASSFLTPKKPALDVRLQQWNNDPTWFQAQLGGAISVGTTNDAPIVFKRTYPRQSTGQDITWIQPFLNAQVGPTVAQYGPPCFSGNSSFVTRSASLKDPRYDFIDRTFGIPFDPGLLVGPYSNYQSYQTLAGKVIDVRSGQWTQDVSYITKIIQAPNLASFAPIWAQQAQAFRTPDGKKLQVQYYSWDSGVTWELIPASIPVPTWAGAFAQAAGSYRTAERAKLDPRLQSWTAGDGGWMWWIVTNPPPPPPNFLVVMRDAGSQIMYMGTLT